MNRTSNDTYICNFFSDIILWFFFQLCFRFINPLSLESALKLSNGITPFIEEEIETLLDEKTGPKRESNLLQYGNYNTVSSFEPTTISNPSHNYNFILILFSLLLTLSFHVYPQ